MLSELQIQNIAVIKEAVLTFTNGFNVMTGETGAGKSIVIDAINAVLGCRISRELIRTGCDSAFVSALFYTNNRRIADMLQTLDVPAEDDGSVLIQRRMFADGRNNCKINGVTVTVSAIRQLARFLVSIHGQSDNQTLRKMRRCVNAINPHMMRILMQSAGFRRSIPMKAKNKGAWIF